MAIYAAAAVICRKKHNLKLKNHIANVIFIVYVLLLLSVTVNMFRGFDVFTPEHRVSLVPLQSLIYAVKNISDIYILMGLILNILLFVPLGFFLPLVFPRWAKRLWIAVLCGLGVSLTIEVTQLLMPSLGRAFDVDDLIFNTLGAALGYFIYFLAEMVHDRFAKSGT